MAQRKARGYIHDVKVKRKLINLRNGQPIHLEILLFHIVIFARVDHLINSNKAHSTRNAFRCAPLVVLIKLLLYKKCMREWKRFECAKIKRVLIHDNQSLLLLSCAGDMVIIASTTQISCAQHC